MFYFINTDQRLKQKYLSKPQRMPFQDHQLNHQHLQSLHLI